MSEDKNQWVVFENKKNGSRFMTPYNNDSEYKDNDIHIVVEKDVSEETAKLLCKERRANNYAAFMSGIPDELRDPATDAYIRTLLLNDDK